MAEPTVYAVQLPGGAGGSGMRYVAQQDRDERLFREAWFRDFRERWRRDLYAQRIAFAVRMEIA
jgi:hypothetical protein